MSTKGKGKGKRAAAEDDEGGAAAPSPALPLAAAPTFAHGALVNPKRVHALKAAPAGAACAAAGPVVYWMSRDQRASDNWALLHAACCASRSSAPVAVAFNLLPAFAGFHTARTFGFMLRGLRLTAASLRDKGLPFFLVRGDATATIPELLTRLRASRLVVDFSPLRGGREQRAAVAAAAPCAVDEVDAHNVVPIWVPSDKQEYAARTLRPKVTAQLPTFLTEFPSLPAAAPWPGSLPQPAAVDWDGLISEATADAAVPELAWATPGEAGGRAVLLSPTDGFLTKRIRLYEKRNDPCVPQALSGLSAWLHFGQLSAQRCALEAMAVKRATPALGKAVDSFLEELVLRRELADNFCFHNKHYDSLDGASKWATDSLALHSADKREHVYTRAQLEAAKTHDALWNAAQLQLVHVGKMHGFMRCAAPPPHQTGARPAHASFPNFLMRVCLAACIGARRSWSGRHRPLSLLPTAST